MENVASLSRLRLSVTYMQYFNGPLCVLYCLFVVNKSQTVVSAAVSSNMCGCLFYTVYEEILFLVSQIPALMKTTRLQD